MRIVDINRRASIFDSRAEGKLFHKLDSRWSPRLRLLAQTPLRSLFEIPQAGVEAMKPRHLRYFRSASVDFTFVDAAGRPLLSIEFDGIGGGYGRGRGYVPANSTSDARRKWKFDFKLRAAARAGYPLFVVSFEETEHFETEESVMIVDGIVGQLFSREQERRLLEDMVAEDEDYIDRLPTVEAHEHVEDLLLQASVLSDLEHDPLAVAIAEESQRLFERFGLGTGEAHFPWMYDPPAPTSDSFPPAPEIAKARIAAFRNARRVGARVGIATGTGIEESDYVHSDVWIRNIGQEHGLVPELIASQLAHLCALRKLRRAAEAGCLSAAGC